MRTLLLTLAICVTPLFAQEAPKNEARILRHDGTTVTGRVEKVIIKNASLGEVTVDGAKITKIAFAAFRPFDDAARKEAERLVPSIGDDDPAKREAAAEKIRRMGPGVLSLLKSAPASDPDMKFRINELIETLETAKGRPCDTVEGRDFFIDGSISSLIVDGKPIDLREVKSISLNPPPDAGDVVGAWTLDVDAMLEEMKKNPDFKKMLESNEATARQMEEMIRKIHVVIDISIDNTFTGLAEGMGNKSTVKGTWNLEGDKLTMTTTEEDGKPKTETEIITFKNGLITIEKDGMKMTLKRK